MPGLRIHTGAHRACDMQARAWKRQRSLTGVGGRQKGVGNGRLKRGTDGAGWERAERSDQHGCGLMASFLLVLQE